MTHKQQQEQLYNTYGYQCGGWFPPNNGQDNLEDVREYSPPLIPDHVLAAREDCVRTFVNDVLIPRGDQATPLTALELQRLAIQHKHQFTQAHPYDLSEEPFELILNAEMYLWGLYGRFQHDPEQFERIKRVLGYLKPILDDDLEELAEI
ncbi:MAG: hypothetical protein MUF87_01360 [Anaerolineae bacterium]|jgi:hypothetical protein|nr:hypothetical protein [Anaerolineae bacterium]